MRLRLLPRWRYDSGHAAPRPHACETILSFDVEEHHRIEAAAGLRIPAALQKHYEERLVPSTEWLLEQLEQHRIQATFFIVGEITRTQPRLIRRIAEMGHEVASHSWDHRRVHHHTAESFRADLRQSRDALQQAAGQAVVGYRAPTFSIGASNAWALDVLAEEGFLYDSSIFPIRHDRYGEPRAPRTPFRAGGGRGEILEIPIATYRLCGFNFPAGGGGYFRLFPLGLMRRALQQIHGQGSAGVAMLYFHPWEFDPEQQRLPLSAWRRFRTYVGVGSSRPRLQRLLAGRRFVRADAAAVRLKLDWASLPSFSLSGRSVPIDDSAACAAGLNWNGGLPLGEIPE